ncbi:hypothetical protein [Mesorhizobium sp. M0159]|uniref:hypothetical protein n=1 Tax=unclassified Mesorhizobium TaxID=325217 RepID=UPI003334F4F5
MNLGSEDVMDIYSLVAANLQTSARRSPMNAEAENRYYSKQLAVPRFGPGLLRSIAMTASVVLVIGIVLI